MNSLIFLILMVYIISTTIFGEIRKLMPTCSTNSCLISGNLPTRNCFCDSKCSLIYNDCCLDASYRTFRTSIRRRNNQQCMFVHGENIYFWMVATCKDSWIGHEHVKEKCARMSVVAGETSDLMEAVPVTNTKLDVTYKNYYCALCNDVFTEDLVEWRVKALCSSIDVSQEDVLQNFTYIEEKSQWGVWKWSNNNNETDFRECYLLFEKPSNTSRGIRSCTSGMISACPRSWQNITVRRKCKSYLDPVKWSDGIIYRNIDCGLCNNRTTDRFQCVTDITRGSNAIMLERAMSVDISSSGQWF